ncbi:T9SS type A sorting domain-containing protein [candidate division KSB1 bacterium]|nr:T9SS type A sorting domain-containing protein [candidate division KSB1 bacterium]
MTICKKNFLPFFLLLLVKYAAAQEASFFKDRLSRPGDLQAFAADTNLTLVNRWAYGPNYACFVDTPYAYIGNGGVLQILNVSQPRSPKLVGELKTPGVIQDIFVKGGHAFVAASANVRSHHPGLRIINVSNPASPSEVGSLAFGVISPAGVYVDGGYAYVANLSAGLRIVNIANPVSPALVGTYDTPGSANAVFVSGSHAFVADGMEGLRVIDVSNPSTPTEVGFYDSPGASRWVTVQGQYAYVADGAAGLRVVNISNPARPVETGFFSAGGDARGVALVGNMACVSDNWNGLQFVNVSNPSSPFGVSTLATFTHERIGNGAARVCAAGTTLFVSDWFNGLHLVDASNANAPVELAYVPTGSWAYDIKIEGATAYLIHGARGLVEMDVSDPIAPRAVRAVNPESWGYSQSVEVTDKHLIVSCGFGGVRILSKSSLTEVSSYVPGPYIYNAKPSLDGKYLFVPAGPNGFHIVDVQNVASPLLIAQYETPSGYVFDAVVNNNRAYLSDFNGRYFILDITDLARPVLLGMIQTSQTGGNHIALRFPYLYAADGDGGLQILDVSNASNITSVNTLEPGSFGWRVQLVGNLLYYCNFRYGVLVFDATNPIAPVLVGSFDTVFQPQSTAMVENYLYVADGAGGLAVLQTNFPTSVEEKETSPPFSFSVSQNYPNPFNPETVIRFALPQASHVVVKIFNVLGAEVRTLVDEQYETGYHHVRWDGKDKNGKQVASGVYLYQLRAGSFSQVKKMSLLR